MFRISVLLMAILLLFMTPVSFAQQDSVEAQAKADANSDMSKVTWFMLGGVSSTAGCVLGCVGGCLFGRILDPGSAPDFFLYAPFTSRTQVGCALAGSILLGALAVPAAVFMYPHNVMPPPERLLGKSPEYIDAYTQIYKSKTVSLRKTLVTKGSIAGNVGFALAMLLVFINI